MSVQLTDIVDAGKGNTSTRSPSKKRKHEGHRSEPKGKKKKRKHELGEQTDSPQQRDTNPATNAATNIEPDGTTAQASTLPDVDIPDASPLAQESDQCPIRNPRPSAFHSVRVSLYLPIPAVSLSTASQSLLSTHLSPLLLTFFHPAGGIVLGFDDPAISATPDRSSNLPLVAPASNVLPDGKNGVEKLALAADEFGVSWAWLTVTLLVLRPEKGQELPGWINVSSEGFVGLICYNYFQAGVSKTRIPHTWKWMGLSQHNTNRRKRLKKGKIKDRDGQQQYENGGQLVSQDSQDTIVPDEESNCPPDITEAFERPDGTWVSGTVTFHVVDCEMVPAHRRDTWTLQIQGTFLDSAGDKEADKDAQLRFEKTHKKAAHRFAPSATANNRFAQDRRSTLSPSPSPGLHHREGGV